MHGGEVIDGTHPWYKKEIKLFFLVHNSTAYAVFGFCKSW
jgi:hypothetical protein